jgi:hypothetical protein
MPIKKRRNGGNGYVVYPIGTGHMSLTAARKAAKAEAKRDGYARVESIDTGKTIGIYRRNPHVYDSAGKYIGKFKRKAAKIAARVVGGTVGKRPKKNPQRTPSYERWAVMSRTQGDVEKPYTISEHSSKKAALAAKRKVSSAKRPYIQRLSNPIRIPRGKALAFTTKAAAKKWVREHRCKGYRSLIRQAAAR